MVARHQDQLRPKYVLSQGPRPAQTPSCFCVSSLERTDGLRCNALRCRCAARKVRGRKEATCGKPRDRTSASALVLRTKRRRCRAGMSRTVAVLGAGGPLCASAVLASIASQASRRTSRRREAEVRASRGARDDSGSSVVARILRGRLRRQGPALQWTRSQCKKRRSLCDRHRVRALERTRARAGGQGWAGLSGGRWVGGRGKCRSRSRSRSRSCSWRSQFTPFTVGVGVAIAIAKQAGLVGPQYTGDWAGQDRTGTGTRVQARAQTQAQGWRVGHRILAVWDETRLYEVCRACKRVAVGGVVCCSYPSTYIECCIWQR